MQKFGFAAVLAVSLAGMASADMVGAPPRGPDEGNGPFKMMVIRNATIIDGTGAPPTGPMDIVIENNIITDIKQAGWPGLPQKEGRDPQGADFEIDATGKYVMPGFVDTHVHGGGDPKSPELEYAYKLWLGHGVTTVRGVSLAPHDLSRSEAEKSERGEIVAPRIYNYQTMGSGWDGGRVETAETARAWVQWAAENGVDGIKFFLRNDERPETVTAAIDEAHKLGLGTVAHISQPGVGELNARDLGEIGLDSVTHFYGHFEALLPGRSLQDYPASYNYLDEQARFGEVAEIWDDVNVRDEVWYDYLKQQRDNNVIFNPTLGIYAASRDLMRARNADWNDEYTLPSLMKYFQSTRDNHGSYFFDWTTENEIAWKRYFERYMQLISDYKDIGGLVTVGTDSGFIWKTYGFAYVEELELLREAGFTPLEIIRAATKDGATELARASGEPPKYGVIRTGMIADLVIVPENPLANLKTLYGTGHERLNDDNVIETVGGVDWTITRGVAYDARQLLADVRAMVDEQKQAQPEASTN